MSSSNRRMSMGAPPRSRVTQSRRMSIDISDDNADTRGNNAHRPPRGRKSMMPRIGRENSSTPNNRAAGRKSMIPRVGRENSPTPNNRAAPNQSSADGLKKTSASNRRRSISSTGRRQSYLPPVPGSSVAVAAVQRDPRPITDRGFQQQCIKRLLAFLVDQGYEYPITPKTLARPSGKDFTNIVTFMLRKVDPNFQEGTMKIEDEIAMNFKFLGYPFSVSKTALVAAGSSHTWPPLLAALTWLMEQLQCLEVLKQEDLENTSQHYGSLDELQEKTDKAFYRYVGKAYQAFMLGDEGKQETLEQTIAETVEQGDAYIEEQVERLTDLNATVVERINALNEEVQDLPTYTKKREDYAIDVEQMDDLIRQLDEHRAALKQKVSERTSELAETDAKLNKMENQVKGLEKSIESQELSVDDIRRMKSEQKGYDEAMDRTLALKESRRKAIAESANELALVSNELEAVLTKYNAKQSELMFIPEISAQSTNMRRASLDKEKLLDSDEKDMLGVDVKMVVQPGILRLKTSYMEKVDEAKGNYQDTLDKLGGSEVGRTEAAAKLEIIQDKITKCEEILERENEAHVAKLAVRQREVDAVETKVAALRDPVALEEQIARFGRQVSDLEVVKAKNKEDNISKKESVAAEIGKIYLMQKEEEERMVQKIEELKNYWGEKLGQVGKISVPSNIPLVE